MNKIFLQGRLTRDMEVKYTQSDKPLAIGRFGIAVDRRIKSDNGSNVDFINCVAFGGTAENINKFFKKGNMIVVIGRLTVTQWTDKEGKKRNTTEVVIDEFYFTGEKTNKSSMTDKENESSVPDFYSVEESVDDDDLPF